MFNTLLYSTLHSHDMEKDNGILCLLSVVLDLANYLPLFKTTRYSFILSQESTLAILRGNRQLCHVQRS